MNAVKNAARTAKNALAFRSFRGHDPNDGEPTHAANRGRRAAHRTLYVKRAGAHAARVASKAETRACAAE